MSFDLVNTAPPENTGADTFRRYRYQAEIAFPYCLSCLTVDGANSVIMEHFEDMVVEYNNLGLTQKR